MTTMEQIEAISVLACEEGLSYGEYVEKYPNCMEKPEPTNKTKKHTYYHGIEHKRYKERVTYELVCKCGKTFTAKRKDAKWCEKCTRDRAAVSTKKWKKKKRAGAIYAPELD